MKLCIQMRAKLLFLILRSRCSPYISTHSACRMWACVLCVCVCGTDAVNPIESSAHRRVASVVLTWEHFFYFAKAQINSVCQSSKQNNETMLMAMVTTVGTVRHRSLSLYVSMHGIKSVLWMSNACDACVDWRQCEMTNGCARAVSLRQRSFSWCPSDSDMKKKTNPPNAVWKSHNLC